MSVLENGVLDLLKGYREGTARSKLEESKHHPYIRLHQMLSSLAFPVMAINQILE